MLVDYAPDGMEAPELKKYSENVPTIVVQKEGLYQGGGLKPMDLIQFQMTPVNHKIISAAGWIFKTGSPFIM